MLRLVLKVTEEQKRLIKAKAAINGMTVSQYVLKLVESEDV